MVLGTSWFLWLSIANVCCKSSLFLILCCLLNFSINILTRGEIRPLPHNFILKVLCCFLMATVWVLAFSQATTSHPRQSRLICLWRGQGCQEETTVICWVNIGVSGACQTEGQGLVLRNEPWGERETHTNQGVGSLTVKANKSKKTHICYKKGFYMANYKRFLWGRPLGVWEKANWSLKTNVSRLTGTLPILAVDSCLN